ncbi:protein NPAT-like isoform X2 [Xenia sp. Carnegie-2017]|uniref:protein NPAT-like isoform X2 n=1 Tax=Xenia sp. Carnegie-2017 TaxID=2897299 RepID=UPI001F03810E|nr:protein NPAT-like isoform X2 [Xenia sp. Carnegie-2017]
MLPSDLARLVYGYLEEKGLEATRNVFAKESFDLLAGDVQTPAIEGQKLSLIVDEYFLLKGVDMKGGSSDPENLLRLLWKQFDIVVGQLKHTTIPSFSKPNNRVRNVYKDQKARSRHFNKQNWVTLQQQKRNTQPLRTRKTVILPDIANGSKSRSKTSPRTSLEPQIIGNGATVPSNNKTSENLHEIDPSKNCGIVDVKSPKRKSVTPRKRTTEKLPLLPSHQEGIGTTPSTIAGGDGTGIMSLVEKILIQPELSEKLAENINKAVEIEAVSSTKSPEKTKEKEVNVESNFVVDSSKIDDIVEMMKSDPAFEDIFSSFADETFDGSTLLANPSVSNSNSVSLETPLKNMTTMISPSPKRGSSLSVAQSPNVEIKNAQAPMAHVRQLNFVSNTCGHENVYGQVVGDSDTVFRDQITDTNISYDKTSPPCATMNSKNIDNFQEIGAKSQNSGIVVFDKERDSYSEKCFQESNGNTANDASSKNEEIYVNKDRTIPSPLKISALENLAVMEFINSKCEVTRDNAVSCVDNTVSCVDSTVSCLDSSVSCGILQCLVWILQCLVWILRCLVCILQCLVWILQCLVVITLCHV